MKSISAMNSFRNTVHNIEPHGHDYKTKCKVTYNAFGKSQTEILEVFILVSGYEPTIRLDIFEKGRVITSKLYHMDFNPAFSDNTKFLFDTESRTLVIEGTNSPRLGNYSVLIEELR